MYYFLIRLYNLRRESFTEMTNNNLKNLNNIMNQLNTNKNNVVNNSNKKVEVDVNKETT